MKNILNNILIASLFLLTATSCDKDFLDKNEEVHIIPTGKSTIYLSPEWESADYQLHIPDARNAEFKIESKPSWLQIHTKSGKLANSMATLHCSATEMVDYNKIGVYLDKLNVSVGEKSYYIPVAYITEGNPNIEIKKTLNIKHNSYLEIGNSGKGILVWDIVSLPNWLSIDANRFISISPEGIIIPQHSSALLPLIINSDKVYNKYPTGKIVLKTNDKNNPRVEIEITLDLGNQEEE